MQIFINNFMNYLTNYYKNLSEQLQEQVNYLENILIEAKKKMVVDKKTGRKVEVKKVQLLDIDGGNFDIAPAKGKGAARERTGTLPTSGAFPQFGTNQEQGYVIDVRAPYMTPDNPIKAALRVSGDPIEVDASQISMNPRERGRNVRGAGKKKLKKEIAIAREELKKPYSQRRQDASSRDTRQTRNETIRGGQQERVKRSVLANAISRAQDMEAKKTNITNPEEYARLQALIKRM
jgi:hypothetical protein